MQSPPEDERRATPPTCCCGRTTTAVMLREEEVTATNRTDFEKEFVLANVDDEMRSQIGVALVVLEEECR